MTNTSWYSGTVVKLQQAKQQAVQTGLPVFVSMQVTKNTTVSQAQMAIAYQEAHKVDRVVSITSNYKPRVHPKNPHMKLVHLPNFDHLKKGQMYRVSIRPETEAIRKWAMISITERPFRDLFRTPLGENRSFLDVRTNKIHSITSGDTAIFLEQTDNNIKLIVGDVVAWLPKEQDIRFKRITARMLRRSEAQEGPQVLPDD